MNTHELGCRPNSTCKASSKHLPAAKPSALPNRTDHVRVTTTGMKRIDQGHIHPNLEVPGLIVPAVIEPGGGRRAL
jgi:hypothetical protein